MILPSMRPRGIHNLIRNQAERAPEAIALRAPGRTPLTYRGLYSQIGRVVGGLRELGLMRNDRVAIVLPNGPDSASAFLAVSAGMTSAPLNPGYGADEFRFYLEDLRARALIVRSGEDSPARSVSEDLGIPVIELTPLEEAGAFTLSGAAGTEHVEYAEPEDIALVLHTSGTTSRPKLVPLTQENLCASACNIAKGLHLASSDLCLNVMPLFHIHGLIGALLSTMASGAGVICTPGMRVDSFFEWLEEFRPTWYSAVPTMHQAILSVADAKQDVLRRHRLRFIRSSSAALPTSVLARLEEVFEAPVIEAYGMTEASHQIAGNPLPPAMRKPGSVGLPSGTEVSIHEETGEVLIRGENVTGGYETASGDPPDAFLHGWLRTGDQGRLDSDGYLYLTGRLKEIINRGGEKIAPAEVDEALLTLEEIAEAVTFAVPHRSLGEDVVSAVVLRKGATVSEGAIREHAFRRLADVKVPSRILMLNAIPKGPTGKVQRIGLAERLKAELRAEYVAPKTPAETGLAEIWKEVLEVERVGLRDNFFALGGDSLTAARVVVRINRTFRVDVPLEAVFRDPSLEAMAHQVESLILDEIESMGEAG